MDMKIGAWTLMAGLIGAAAFAFRSFSTRRRRTAELDLGGVSQSWLTEHKAGKGDRFS
jgi:hypothetical protein